MLHFVSISIDVFRFDYLQDGRFTLFILFSRNWKKLYRKDFSNCSIKQSTPRHGDERPALRKHSPGQFVRGVKTTFPVGQSDLFVYMRAIMWRTITLKAVIDQVQIENQSFARTVNRIIIPCNHEGPVVLKNSSIAILSNRSEPDRNKAFQVHNETSSLTLGLRCYQPIANQNNGVRITLSAFP